VIACVFTNPSTWRSLFSAAIELSQCRFVGAFFVSLWLLIPIIHILPTGFTPKWWQFVNSISLQFEFLLAISLFPSHINSMNKELRRRDGIAVYYYFRRPMCYSWALSTRYHR
jgi:hypothetical protein